MLHGVRYMCTTAASLCQALLKKISECGQAADLGGFALLHKGAGGRAPATKVAPETVEPTSRCSKLVSAATCQLSSKCFWHMMRHCNQAFLRAAAKSHGFGALLVSCVSTAEAHACHQEILCRRALIRLLTS